MSKKYKGYELELLQKVVTLVNQNALVDKADEYFPYNCVGLSRKGAAAILDGLEFVTENKELRHQLKDANELIDYTFFKYMLDGGANKNAVFNLVLDKCKEYKDKYPQVK